MIPFPLLPNLNTLLILSVEAEVEVQQWKFMKILAVEVHESDFSVVDLYNGHNSTLALYIFLKSNYMVLLIIIIIIVF